MRSDDELQTALHEAVEFGEELYGDVLAQVLERFQSLRAAAGNERKFRSIIEASLEAFGHIRMDSEADQILHDRQVALLQRVLADLAGVGFPPNPEGQATK